jgi:hypothetical protein
MDTATGSDPSTSLKARLGRRFKIFKTLIDFLWKQKMWWLIPMICILGTLALLAGGSAMSGVAPLIYVLF